jgi:acyl-CoA synthetase (NDP forming)
VTVSGGAGAWSADALVAAGLDVPELGAGTQAAIRAFIPSYGSARNPVDLTAAGVHGGGLLRAVDLLSHDPEVDQIAVITSLSNPKRVSIYGPELATLLAQRLKPVLFYSYTLPSSLGRRILAEAGAVIMPSMAVLATACRALAERDRHTAPAPAEPEALPEAVRTVLSSHAGPLAEHAAKALLAACGAAISPARLITHAAELEEAAAALGFPLAAKIQSPAILHKTEAGGVRLGIADLPALEAAYAKILANAARHAPEAVIDGVLLEPMAARGVEIIVGVIRDPSFGPVVMVGAGGVATELFQDTAYRLAPVDEAEATVMLRELRSAGLLDGFRGAPPADIPALARLVALVSRFADAGRAAVAELELNPVIVHPAGQGCTIADALLMLSPADQPER